MIKLFLKEKIKPLIYTILFSVFLLFFTYSILEYKNTNYIDFFYNGINDIFNIKLSYLLNMNYYSLFYLLFTYFMIIYLSRISLDIFDNDISNPIYASPFTKKEIVTSKIITTYAFIIVIFLFSFLINITVGFSTSSQISDIFNVSIIYCLITIFSFSLVNILNVHSLKIKIITNVIFYVFFLTFIVLVLPLILTNNGLILNLSIITFLLAVNIFSWLSIKYSGNKYNQTDLKNKNY